LNHTSNRTPKASSDLRISANIRSTPRTRNSSTASASGSARMPGSAATTRVAISPMYSPPYPFSGAGRPAATAYSERANRVIWEPASLK